MLVRNSSALQPARLRRSAHDPGLVLRDTAVMLATGGNCVSDLATLRGQEALFGPMASNVTAWRVLRQKAPGCLAELRTARAAARAYAWKAGGGPTGTLTLDFDSTLVTAHSEKEEARGNYKRGFDFHPLVCFVDRGSECGAEPLAGILRPGNASPDNAADHVELSEQALAQVPEQWLTGDRPKLARSDSAGASHGFVNAVHEAGLRFSIGLPGQGVGSRGH
jgi:Transposase DDE domain group 1